MAGIRTISTEDLKRKMDREPSVQVINVLESEHWGLGLIRGSKRIPLSQLKDRLSELDRSKEVITYCAGPRCTASRKAAEFLEKEGFHVLAYEGGIEEWTKAGLPMEAKGVSEAKGGCQKPSPRSCA
jgi:rhodanese-related sulfurtransferase